MILHNLTQEEMAAIEKAGVLRTFSKGEPIIREGAPGSSFFLILDGVVEVRKGLDSGKYKKLVELGPLDIIGEVCFLGVENRSATVVALEPSQLMEFERAQFDRLITDRPLIGLKLYRSMACELAHRLAKVDSELKDALLWALRDTDSFVGADVRSARKLSLVLRDTA